MVSSFILIPDDGLTFYTFKAKEQLHHASKRDYDDYDDDEYTEPIHDRHSHGHRGHPRRGRGGY